jgi:hypothetical protein
MNQFAQAMVGISLLLTSAAKPSTVIPSEARDLSNFERSFVASLLRMTGAVECGFPWTVTATGSGGGDVAIHVSIPLALADIICTRSIRL